uniref:Uncharacterized protein n=1 Tax=Anguilla anguilla TaxID=7936 RepID=A0A0E9PGU8_ANGAN
MRIFHLALFAKSGGPGNVSISAQRALMGCFFIEFRQ